MLNKSKFISIGQRIFANPKLKVEELHLSKKEMAILSKWYHQNLTICFSETSLLEALQELSFYLLNGVSEEEKRNCKRAATYEQLFFKQPLYIAIEGVDGSGKGTQAQLLEAHLKQLGYQTTIISFPNYDGFIGKEIGERLSGKGSETALSLHAKSMSLWYAADRFETMKKVNVQSYDLIILNRFSFSNVAYQCSRENGDDSIGEWIIELEQGIFGLPFPELNLILDVEPKQSFENVTKKDTRQYTPDSHDVYEKSNNTIKNARNKYLELAKKYDNFVVLQCQDRAGMKDLQVIHQEIMQILVDWKFIDDEQ